jgi:hypothetical protein
LSPRWGIRCFLSAFALSFALFSAAPVQAQAEVDTYVDLQNAAAASVPSIKLTGNITDGASQLNIVGNLTLDLNGFALTIALDAATGAASNGIKIGNGITLTLIDNSAAGTGTLTATNGANTQPTDGNGAAINTTDGTLIIESGTVDARGGRNSAGIGGGRDGAGGIITINGGTVNARGGGDANGGAGIGGGFVGSGGTITINGGIVNTIGGNWASGIGGGDLGTGGTIMISGGTVSATGGTTGAGIGSGQARASGDITITGNADVTAIGSTGGAGIGSGMVATVRAIGTILINTTGTVAATGGAASGTIGAGAAIGQGGYDGGGNGTGVSFSHPADRTVNEGANAVFSFPVTAVGTTPPAPTYQWRVSTDGGANFANVTDGTGQTAASYGTVAATPAMNGNLYRNTMTASNVNGDGTGTITIVSHPALLTVIAAGVTPPEITTPTGALTAGVIGTPYSVTLAANNNPTSWAVSLGTLPAGLSLGNDGVISGTPTATGTANFSVTATNADGPSARVPFSILINPVFVTGITVSGAGGATTITTNNGTLQMSAAVLPANATNGAVNWSVTNGTGSATINASGLLTATGNGTVTVTAAAADGSGVTGTLVITISGQTLPSVPVTGITVSGAGSATTITTNGGTLQMSAAVLPANATNPAVNWSVANGTGSATINASGLLRATGNGTVTVTATATDGSGVTGTLVITISGQTGALTSAQSIPVLNPVGLVLLALGLAGLAAFRRRGEKSV